LAVWIIDRFNPRQRNTLEDARRSMLTSRSTSETELVLNQIDREKKQVSILIGMAIEGSWVGYANAMGLVYRERDTPESRQIVTMGDLRLAIKQLALSDRMAALYFLTGFTRDVIYQQVLWGASHQAAVEDCVMERMGARFATPRWDMTPGHKTCVGILYGKLYNHRKQRLFRAILPVHITVAVCKQQVSQSTHWKRPKTAYFVHETKTTTDAGGNAEKTVKSEMVRVETFQCTTQYTKLTRDFPNSFM
jgi:hypothetical protein